VQITDKRIGDVIHGELMSSMVSIIHLTSKILTYPLGELFYIPVNSR